MLLKRTTNSRQVDDLRLLSKLESGVQEGAEMANLKRLAADQRARADRFRVMARLLDGRDERFVLSAPGGSRDIAVRMRRKRRRIYFAYVFTFTRAANRVQRERIKAQTVTLASVHEFNFRLAYMVAGMAGAGLMDLLRIPKAAAVADYFLKRALPLIVPDAIVEIA